MVAKPQKNPEYLAWIRDLPCVVCGFKGPNAAHHMGDGRGSRRSSDYTTVPVCDFSVFLNKKQQIPQGCYNCHHEVIHKHPANDRQVLRELSRLYYKFWKWLRTGPLAGGPPYAM